MTPSTRYIFFTGKGGVGKTSLAASCAVSLADGGAKVLIISTDPASNLDEVFGVALGSDPSPVPGAASLWAANLDPEAAAASYREKMVAPYRGKLPAPVIRTMEEQFSGACTTEIAAFDEFVGFLSASEETGWFDHIVFDTAPTGHTLRLLSLPGAWSGYLGATTSESSCLGPLAGLQEKRDLYQRAFEALADPEFTAIVLVARPDPSSLKEADRSAAELAELGLQPSLLILNGVFENADPQDPLAISLEEQGRRARGTLGPSLAGLPVVEKPLLASTIAGIEALRSLASARSGQRLSPHAPPPQEPFPEGISLEDLVEILSAQGKGVILTMGKGGVGKTTIAVRIARELARQGHAVRLATTDPAGNLADAARGTGIDLRAIDPKKEVEAYAVASLEKAKDILEPDALALLEEDLRSPCTEEIAVFRAFASLVAEGEDGFVVIDTAPTGHTILLMDAAEAYHREVSRTSSDAPESVKRLLGRLRDPSYTQVVLVALPEPTPVHEAMRLSGDLERAGITPRGWVLNRCFGLSGFSDELIRAKASAEAGPAREAASLGLPLALIPWMPQPLPTGTET